MIKINDTQFASFSIHPSGRYYFKVRKLTFQLNLVIKKNSFLIQINMQSITRPFAVKSSACEMGDIIMIENDIEPKKGVTLLRIKSSDSTK